MSVDKFFTLILMIIFLIGILFAVIINLLDKYNKISGRNNQKKQKKKKEQAIEKTIKYILLNAAIDYQKTKLVCDDIVFKIRVGLGNVQSGFVGDINGATSEYINENIKIKQAYDPMDWLAKELNQYNLSDTFLVKIIVKTFNTDNLISKVRCYQVSKFKIVKELSRGD